MIVSGTKIISETSFVTNIEERKTEYTKKQVKNFIELKREVFCKSGEKIFSFLKPSKTESSIKSVARVFQSIWCKSSLLGGVIKSETIAAISETESIISFLKIAIIRLNIFANYNKEHKKCEDAKNSCAKISIKDRCKKSTLFLI